MSLFSVNTNLGAMAALQSLTQTQNALSNTQNQISTGQKISSAADNPAIYSITQAMNGQIAGLTAVQDGLSFSSQVVGTASSSATSISSTLATLQQTLTQGQQTGINTTQINNSISGALALIDSFANSATLNGVNLIAGATGNGVTNTQLQVLTSTQGDSFTVGGTGAQALNATSAGLGLSGLSVTSTDTQVALGADSAASGKGLTLVASGAALTGASGQTATSTALQLQTSNYTTGGTAQNVAAQTIVLLNDGSANGNADILNQINASVYAATGRTGTASYQNGSPLALGSSSALTGTTFTLAAGSPTLSTSGTGATTVDVPSSGGTAVGQFTQYTIGKGSNLAAVQNSDGSTTYTLTDATGATGNQVSSKQTYLASGTTDGAAVDVNSLSNGTSITLASGVAAPTTGQTLSVASTTNPGDTSLLKIGANANIAAKTNTDGTTTYTITDATAGESTIQDYKPATTAGSAFTLNSDGTIGVTAGSQNGSITDLGNGSKQYTFVTARDGNGNATSEVNIISANLSQLTVPSTSSNLGDALNGASTNNSAAAVATRTAALNVVVSALNATGFNASIDANNNLTIAGNNINTTGAAGNTTATTQVSNFAGAAGTGIGGITTTTSTVNTGTATLSLGNDTIGATGIAGQVLVASGNTTLATSTGAAAQNTNVTLTTSNFGTKASESATNVGSESVVMLSDGTTSATADVLNQLNALSHGIADSGAGTNGSDTVTNKGSVFTVNSSGAIVLASGQTGGSISKLSDGSTQYSYVTQTDGSGNAIEKVSVTVASISAAASANTDAALNGASATDTAANQATRAATLGTLANAVNASGYNATLNASTGGLTISGTNLSKATVGGFTAATISPTATATLALTAGATVATSGSEQTATPTSTNSSITLQTNNYGTAADETATNPGVKTSIMASDGSGFGSALTLTSATTTSNSLNDVLNQLNTLSAGSADTYGSGSLVSGSVFNVNNAGEIVAASGGGGTVSTLSDGSKEYSFTSGTNQKVNLIVANVAVGASAATTLGAMATAANAAGFTAAVDATNNVSITGANLNSTNTTVAGITNGTAPVTTATVTNTPPATLFNANATTTTSTNTTTTSNAVHGVQQADASAAIANVTAAITKLGNISSQLGTASNHITGMQSFTSTLSSALTAGVGALTDADMATESAKLTSLQTKQQLGIQALSIANQQPQVLLKLFG